MTDAMNPDRPNATDSTDTYDTGSAPDRITQARETLADAIWLMQHRRYAAGVSMLYNACFHSVTAYLEKIGMRPYSHASTHRMFIGKVVGESLIPRALARYYTDLMELRIGGDSREFGSMTPELADEMMADARIFVPHMIQLAKLA